MTRKHYEQFARELSRDLANIQIGDTNRDLIRLQIEYAANLIADIAIQDNPRFDRSRFMKACGLSS